MDETFKDCHTIINSLTVTNREHQKQGEVQDLLLNHPEDSGINLKWFMFNIYKFN